MVCPTPLPAQSSLPLPQNTSRTQHLLREAEVEDVGPVVPDPPATDAHPSNPPRAFAACVPAAAAVCVATPSSLGTRRDGAIGFGRKSNRKAPFSLWLCNVENRRLVNHLWSCVCVRMVD